MMALVRTFTRKIRERFTLHDEVEATYSAFERDGKALLQIDTYGRDARQIPGKQSQTLQFDREAGLALFNILKEAFHF
jgi:hypothetical protein